MSEGGVANSDARRLLMQRVVGPARSVNSGVYSAVDPGLSVLMNGRGEYEYVGLDESYDGPADQILRVSAFGETGPSEDEVAGRRYADQPGAQRHLVAGYYLGSFAGWASDGDLRANASSGGLTTWTLLELLRRDLIDGVIHLVPTAESALFQYRVSRTPEEILGGAKSRYYPGELSGALREVRDVPGRYAVVGIPSFIYEVRLLQECDDVYRDRIRYTIGLICGHQKTANYATALGWQAGFSPGQLRGIDFRKKVAGLPANTYSTEMSGVIDGREVSKVVSQKDLFGTDWGWGLLKSNFSDFTQDALNETADIVFGDAWLPQYVQDSRGANVVLTRDSELHEILTQGAARGDIHLDALPVTEVVRSQASLVRQSVHELPYRFAYLSSRGEYVPPLRRAPTQRLSAGRRRLQELRLQASISSHSALEQAQHTGDVQVFIDRLAPVIAEYRRQQDRARIEAKLAEGPLSLVRSLVGRLR